MTFARDITIASVVTTIAAAVHFMAVELFAPGSILYGVATDGTSVMNGTSLAGFWFEILAVWVPLIAIGGIWAYVFVRMFRRQVITGASAGRPP